MNLRRTLPKLFVAFVVGLSLSVVLSLPTCAEKDQAADPSKVDADFAIQGEYAGELPGKDGAKEKFGVQVIALGDGKFEAVGHHGGLPGAGWNGEQRIKVAGETKDGATAFKSDEGIGTIKDGKMVISDLAGTKLATFDKVERKSQSLGAPAPSGAIVLFDGKSVDNWENGLLTEESLLMTTKGATSKQKFGSHKIHIEFRAPYMPKARGQGRGNSGIYLQGRYEVQMLDSFGLTGEQNECGGIYSVGKPSVNMCLPPLTWQTYDIDYTAGKFDAAGKVVTNPRVTVTHNGVVIHNNIELPGERNTTAAPNKAGPEPGPIYLQFHGNPVRYQNIWVVETK